MTRLSNSIREDMARALVRHRFGERADVLCAESATLFHAVIFDQYDDATRKLMAQIEKKHRNAFTKQNSLTVNVAGRRIEIGARYIGSVKTSWGSHWRAQCESASMLESGQGWNSISYLEGPIADRLIAFADAEQKLREEIDPAYRKALGALAQFGTGKRLASDWPEAMPVIGNLIPENDRQLPVVQVAALNAEFELPPELAEAA